MTVFRQIFRLEHVTVLLITLLLFGACKSTIPDTIKDSEIITLFEANLQKLELGQTLILTWKASPNPRLSESLSCSLKTTTVLGETTDSVSCEASLSLTPQLSSNYQLIASQATRTWQSKSISVEVSQPSQNIAPFVTGDAYQLIRGSSLEVSASKGILANDSDVNGDSLSAKLIEDVRHGKLDLRVDGSFSYSHNGNNASIDFFTYVANDGSLDSSTATVILTLIAVPQTQADSYSLSPGESLNVVASNGVLANDGLSVDFVAQLRENVKHGSLQLNADGSFSYSHDGGESSSDSFSYVANNGSFMSQETQVTFTIIRTPAMLSIPIKSGRDDIEEYAKGQRLAGEIIADSPDLDIGTDGAGKKIVGLRFTAIELDAFTPLDKAYIQFQAYSKPESRGSPRVNIFLIDEANPAVFSLEKNGLSSRPWRYIASWQPKSWSKVGERGKDQRLEVTALVQTALNRKDWQRGNAIAIILDEVSSGLRVAESFENNPDGAATLIIEPKQ